jgi:hypothetical protein
MLREELREAESHRLSVELAVRAGNSAKQGQESQQDEIHMPGLWPERMGQA